MRYTYFVKTLGARTFGIGRVHSIESKVPTTLQDSATLYHLVSLAYQLRRAIPDTGIFTPTTQLLMLRQERCHDIEIIPTKLSLTFPAQPGASTAPFFLLALRRPRAFVQSFRRNSLGSVQLIGNLWEVKGRGAWDSIRLNASLQRRTRQASKLAS